VAEEEGTTFTMGRHRHRETTEEVLLATTDPMGADTVDPHHHPIEEEAAAAAGVVVIVDEEDLEVAVPNVVDTLHDLDIRSTTTLHPIVYSIVFYWLNHVMIHGAVQYSTVQYSTV